MFSHTTYRSDNVSGVFLYAKTNKEITPTPIIRLAEIA